MSNNDNEKKSKKISSISKDFIGVTPFLEFSGNREVLIDGCKGILEYQSEIVRINTGKMVVVFKGRGLNIKCMTTTSLVICGYISNVEFLR